MKHIIGLLVMAVFLLTACEPTATDSATVVEAYLQAKVDSDAEVISELICSDLEASIENEAASFASVEASIDDPQCTANDDNTVTCTGEIIAAYGDENRSLPLATYNVIQEDGEWRWCGEG